MNISLLTDAPKHNLALMKIATWHKLSGDEVHLNEPIFPADYTYASVLFERNINSFIADEYGGPAIGGKLPDDVERLKPDYDLMTIDYSLGYTFRPCWNTCDFCKVPRMDHPDIDHHSIWEFHEARFKKICLLNNNTFMDLQWLETFEEIWDADLTVIDENGYDIRLLDDEKAAALKRTKFDGYLHFAWDRIQDEALVINGLELLQKNKIRARFYVLIGHTTTTEQDLYRCQKLIDHGQDPYIMPYVRTKHTRAFKRFVDSFMWRKYKTVEAAWMDYGTMPRRSAVNQLSNLWPVDGP